MVHLCVGGCGVWLLRHLVREEFIGDYEMAKQSVLLLGCG